MNQSNYIKLSNIYFENFILGQSSIIETENYANIFIENVTINKF